MKKLLLSCCLIGVLIFSEVHSQVINPTGRALTLQTPIELNGSSVGNLLTTIDEQDGLSVATESLIELLADRVSENLQAQILQLDNSGALQLATLAELGITTQFDLSTLSVKIELPSELFRKQTLRVKERRASASNLSLPASFSGYFNVSGIATMRDDEDKDREPTVFTGRVHGAMRLNGPVLAFDIDVLQKPAANQPDRSRLDRVFTTLAADIPAIESRATIGDISIPQTSIFGTPRLFGFNFGRDFEIGSNRIVQPRGQREFSIERASTVTVTQNGRQLRSYNLQPGTYNITDIPLVEGGNNIELLVEDSSGRTEAIDFKTFFTSQLLAPGEVDYSISAGVLESLGPANSEYDPDQPALAASTRYGAADALTVSHSLQLSKETALLDTQTLQATRFGNLKTSIGASLPYDGEPGWFVASDFASANSGWRLGFETRSADFRSSITEVVDNSASDTSGSTISAFLGFNGALTRSIGFNGAFNVVNRQYGQRTISTSASLSGRLGFSRGFNWNIRGIHERTDGEPNVSNITFGLTYRFNSNTQVSSLIDSADKSFELGVLQQQDSGLIGGYELEVNAANRHDMQQINSLNIGYTANRYNYTLRHRTIVPLLENRTRTANTKLQYSSSLVFAGRSVAISRPVTNSFAIVKKHSTLGDGTLRLSPRSSSDLARTDSLGHAVIPDLGVYDSRTINYSIDDLPIGYVLGDGAFYVAPPPSAGYVLQVGSSAIVTLIGALLDKSTGMPIDLVSGEARRSSNDTADPIVFFSNKSGKFAISGLESGDYDIILNTSPERRFTLTVPPDAATLFRAGNIEVP